jgi:hypothetical protein
MIRYYRDKALSAIGTEFFSIKSYFGSLAREKYR